MKRTRWMLLGVWCVCLGIGEVYAAPCRALSVAGLMKCQVSSPVLPFLSRLKAQCLGGLIRDACCEAVRKDEQLRCRLWFPSGEMLQKRLARARRFVDWVTHAPSEALRRLGVLGQAVIQGVEEGRNEEELHRREDAFWEAFQSLSEQEQKLVEEWMEQQRHVGER